MQDSFADYLRAHGLPTGFLAFIDRPYVPTEQARLAGLASIPVVSPGPRPRLCYVVQAGDDGPIKVGSAAEPEKRMKALQHTCPYPLRIVRTYPGGYKTERELHAKLAHLTVLGEWFRPEALALLPES